MPRLCCASYVQGLTTEYRCEKSEPLNISCNAGIVIHRGFFGRLLPDSERCNHSAHHDKTNCNDNNSITIIREKCDGKHTCSLQATTSVFGDPCPGTYKYLEVEYSCTESDTSEYGFVLLSHRSHPTPRFYL